MKKKNLVFHNVQNKTKIAKMMNKYGCKRECAMLFSTKTQSMQKKLQLGASCWGERILKVGPPKFVLL